MKTKTLASIFACFIAIFLVMSGVSAASITNSNIDDIPQNISHTDSSFTITVNITNTAQGTDINFSDSSISIGNASFSSKDHLFVDENESVLTDLIVNINSNHQSGSIEGIVYLGVINGSGTDKSLPFSVNILEEPSLSVLDSTIDSDSNSTTMTIKNNGNVDFSDVELTPSGDFDVDFNITGNFSLDAGNSEQILVTMTTDREDLDVGENKVTITARADGTSTKGTVTTTSDYCENIENEIDNEGKLEVYIDDIEAVNGFGDDNDWYPLDEVEIEFDVENNKDYDMEDIEIEFCLYDVEQKECILDEDDIDLSNDNFDLDKGDDITIIASFKIDADELEEGHEDYEIFIKATGEIDDRDADELDGEKSCSSDSEKNIEIRQEDFVIIDDIKITEVAQCGSEVTLTADVWNIYDRDLDDDEIFVRIYNNELGLNEKIEFPDGIDALDNEKLTNSKFGGILSEGFKFEVPKEIEEGYYRIDLIAYDDEDMTSDDYFELDNDGEDESEYYVLLKVEGNCQVIPETLVEAELESEAVAGEDVIVSTTITNTEDKEVNYEIDVSGYSDWADSVDISDDDFSLDEGDSKTINLTFKTKEDATGKQEFNLDIYSDNEIIKTQEVSVDFGEKQSIWSNITGAFVFDGEGINWTIWLIVAINIILIIAIIIVALRIARR